MYDLSGGMAASMSLQLTGRRPLVMRVNRVADGNPQANTFLLSGKLLIPLPIRYPAGKRVNSLPLRHTSIVAHDEEIFYGQVRDGLLRPSRSPSDGAIPGRAAV